MVRTSISLKSCGFTHPAKCKRSGIAALYIGNANGYKSEYFQSNISYQPFPCTTVHPFGTLFTKSSDHDKVISDDVDDELELDDTPSLDENTVAVTHPDPDGYNVYKLLNPL